jgi:hypothetical protein
MIRVLIIDDGDVEPIVADIQQDAELAYGFETLYINPLKFFGSSEPDASLAMLLEEVKTKADSYLDVVAIDRNLGEVGLPNDGDRHLALTICEAVRETNLATTLVLYSGTLRDYIETSFEMGDRDALLRRIFRAGISTFTPRSRIAREVCSALRNPSWLLRVDRMLMRYAAVTVSPEEAGFRGRTFADLARAVRCQDRDGQKIAELVSEYGVSCLADLNS